MNALMMIFILCTIYIPIIIIFATTPYITRKTICFGVSIPENIYYHAEVKKIRDNYRNSVLLFGGIILVISLFIALYKPLLNEIILPYGIIVEIGIVFILYYQNHKRMIALKEKSNWSEKKAQKVIVDTAFRKRIKRASPWWFLAYVLIILATIGIGFILYDKIPNQIPMNYNLHGEVTNWAQKSYRVLFFIPSVQIFMLCIMAFVYWIIGKSKQQIDATHPEESIKQNTIFRYRWSAFTVFMGLLLIIMFGFMQLTMIGMIQNLWFVTIIPTIITFIIIIAAIVLSVTTGQGGSRLSRKNHPSGDIINHDDDKYWKLGMFYYNPDDPAVFVEKRFGVGWTNNFARPLSWIFFIGLFALILALGFGSSFLLK